MADPDTKSQICSAKKRSIVLYSSMAMIAYAITIPFAISRFTWTYYTDDETWIGHHHYILYHIITLVTASALWCLAALHGVFKNEGSNFKMIFIFNLAAVSKSEELHIIDVVAYLKDVAVADLESSSFTHCINYLVFNTIFGLGVLGLGMKYCCDKCKN